MGDNTVTKWTEEMDQCLLFMDFIGCNSHFMAHTMNAEFNVNITNNSCIGRRYRIAQQGKRYNYKEEDFLYD